MSVWKEPKIDYKAGDQVTPEIFNTLATNEKHLKEIICNIQTKDKSGTETTISTIVLEEV